MVKSIPRLADLSVILSISDSSAEEQFWQAQHTALHLVHKKLSPRSTPSILTSHKQSRSRDSLLALVGCQDGSVWVLDTGRNKKTEAQTANIHVEDTDGSPGSSKLGTPAPSIRNGSPMLSRTSSSTLLHNAALSPPSLSRGDFSSLPQDGAASPKPGRQRTPSILSPNSKPETFSGLGFLPSLGTTGKARSTSVSQSTATARLTSISAADDKALRIKLKDVNRDPADEVAGSLLRLVGDARGGLGELHGRSDTERSSSKSTNKSKPSPRDIKIAIPPPRSASEIRDEEKLDLDVAEAIHEEEEMGRLREAVENAEERSCRECEPINESVENGSTTHNPFLVDLVPQSKFGGSIVALTSSPCDDLVFALSASGVCSSLDLQEMLVIKNFDIDAAWRAFRGQSPDRPDLAPPLRWQELLPCNVGSDNYLLSYGHATTDSVMDQAKDLTTVILLYVEPKSHELSLIGCNTLPGESQVAVAQTTNGLTLFSLTAGSLETYEIHLSDPSIDASKLKSTRSQVDLKSFFTPLPTRPHSRTGATGPDANGTDKDDASKSSDFGKMLGKRLLGRSAGKITDEKSSRVFILGPSRSQISSDVSSWSRIRISGNVGLGWNSQSAQSFEVTSKDLQLQPLNVELLSQPNAVTMLPDAKMATICAKEGFGISDFTSGKHSWKRDGFDIAGSTLIATSADGHVAILGDALLVSEVNTHTRQISDPSRVTARSAVTHSDPSCDDRILPFRGAALVGNSQGKLCVRSFLDVLQGVADLDQDLGTDVDAIESRISSLQLVTMSNRTQDAIFAGFDDGSLRIWNANDLSLMMSQSAFSAPVRTIQPIIDTKGGKLCGSVLLVSEDGAIAVFSLQEKRILYMIPGSEYPLHRLIIQQDDLITVFTHGRARVWNIVSGEFRRSTSADSVAEMLLKGKWCEVTMQSESSAGVVPTQARSDVEMNLLQWKDDIMSPMGWIASLIGPGLSSVPDKIIADDLKLKSLTKNVDFGIRNQYGRARYRQLGKLSWEIGGLQNLLRQVCLITALHRLDRTSPELAAPSRELVAFYSTSLPSVLGHEYDDLDLETLVAWNDHVDAELQHSVRLLLETRLGRISDQDVIILADEQLGYLPVNVASAMKHELGAMRALTLLGNIALSRYSLLKPSTLKDIASSIMLVLKEGTVSSRSAAIDFAHKGFEIWQAYIDPADLLRSLFDLAVMKDEDAKGGHLMTHARTAVLQLASSAGPLFISTVTLDIVTAETIPRRNAIMKLCVFIARRRPTILLPSLPRLAEAVVKSLDPTRVRMRESIQQTATVILNELVSTFPSIDFAGPVQKLAVGTQEGAVIMYDLKTATRLYVLETHRHPVSAISFSPDGRRLVTASLGENKVTIWKVGSSFSGFLNVGGPPRQGSASGEPFKSLDFFVADPGKEIDPATGQQKLKFSWPGDRQACLHIGKMKVTFTT